MPELKDTSTAMLEVSIAETRVLYKAIEHMAYVEKGAGREHNAELLWGVFQRLQRLDFFGLTNSDMAAKRGPR